MKITKFIQEAVLIMIAQQEMMKKEVRNFSEMCEGCVVKNIDFAVSKVVPLICDQLSNEFIPVIIPAIINFVAAKTGVEKWPLTEKALLDMTNKSS